MDMYLALVFFFCVVQTGDSIKCYECKSKNDSTCANVELLEKFKVDCSTKPDGSKYTLCRKIEQHVDFEMNGLLPQARVIRQCGWVNSTLDKSKCYSRTILGGGEQTVCGCHTDYCNSASLVSFTSLLFSSLVLIPIVI